MALSINTLRSEVYKYLNEASNSTLGQIPDGTGGTTTSSDNVVKDWILEACNLLCRSCVYYPVTGTYTLANGAYSVDILSPASISPVGTALWYPTDVFVGSRRLTHASEQSVRANDLDYKTTVTTNAANILYWYRQDNFRAFAYPGNNTGGSVTLTVYGAGTPPAPSSDAANEISFLPDDLLKQLVASYVAIMLVYKNTDDPSVAQRAFWMNQFNEGRMRLWDRLDQSLKMSKQPFSQPPIALQQTR